MKTNRIIQRGLLACLVALAAQPAVAGLKINTIFIGGEPPPASVIAGGGNLQAIMEVAARNWERVFDKGGSQWEVTIEYGWGISTADYASELMLEQGGNPVRITRSRLTFRNTVPSNPLVADWYADPTPKNNSAYQFYTSTLGELTGSDGNPVGEINVGRVFSGATGFAAERVDLLTVAMHEIGHALGLDLEYVGLATQLESGLFLPITPPLPFAGANIYMTQGVPDHIGFLPPLPLMVAHPTPGERQFISGLDALVLAQISSFDRPNLGEPPGVPKVEGEP